MMTCAPDTARETLERDITEALLRLRGARERDAGEEIAICGKRLDWLLDRWMAHIRVDGGMGS